MAAWPRFYSRNLAVEGGQTLGPIDLEFDVTGGLPAAVTGGQRTIVAGWLFLPDEFMRLGKRPMTMTLLSGGSYDKRYYHVEITGRYGYSAAEYLASRGDIVLILDHLGMGCSTRVPNQRKATRHVVALAAHLATTQFYDRLRQGDLHPSLPGFTDFARVGGGHSMGAMQAINQQAGHHTWEALMILGYTADGVNLTINGRKVRPGETPAAPNIEDYTMAGRSMMHETFHWSDVPADVIAADDALCVETPSELGFTSIQTGIVAEEAAQIDVPTYICLGERDVSPDPRAELTYYKSCRDLTLHILPRSGHCQNFAGTRREMWDRMHAWSRSVIDAVSA